MMNTCAKILVVDDDPVIVSAIRRALKAFGYETLGAFDGNQGLQTTREHRPDLVLLGVNKQGMDGFKVCRQIKSDPDLAGIYVIIVSSTFTDSDSQAKGLEFGADGYITRPIANREFLARVQAMLRIQAAEKAVRESEKRYRDLFDNAGLAIFQVTMEGKPLSVNPEFLRIFGYASSEDFFNSIKDSSALFANPEQRAEILRLKAINPILTSFENIYRRKDGSTFTGQLTVREIKGPNHQTIYLEGLIEDISARKQAEEAERKIERQYRQLIEQAADGIFIITPQGKFQLVNSKTCEMLGYREQELLQMNIIDTYLPKFRNEGKKRLAALQAGVNLHFERPMLRKDGSVFLIEATAVVLEDGTIQSIIRDITERRQADDLLKESEVRFKAQYQGLPIPTYSWKWYQDDFILVDVNEAAREITKGQIDQFIGKTATAMYRDRPDVLKEMQECYTSRTTIRREMQMLMRSTGENHDFLVHYAFIPPDLVMVHTLDITERKHVEAELQKNEEKLRAILDATPFPIAIVDRQDNNIRFWSRSAHTLFGHTAPTAAQWYKLAYPDLKYRRQAIKRWKSILETANQSRQSVNTGEYRVTCKDGSVRICELYATFLPDSLIVTFNDITETKRVQLEIEQHIEDMKLLAEINQALNRGEDLAVITSLLSDGWKNLFKGYGASLFLPSADRHKLVMQNLAVPSKIIKQIEKLIGTSISQLELDLQKAHPFRQSIRTGKSQLINNPFGIRETLLSYAESAILNERILSGIKKIIPTVQKLVGVNSEMIVPLLAEGELIGILDIGGRNPFTEEDLKRVESIAGQLTIAIKRKQTEQALQESETKYRTLVDEVNDGFYINDRQGILTFANQALAHIFGVNHPSEIVNRSFAELISPLMRDELLEQYRFAKTTGKTPGLIITEIIRQDGGRAFIEIKPQLIIEDGEPVGDRGIVVDITDRKRAEKLQDAIYRITQAADQTGSLDSLYPSIHSIIKEVMIADNFYIALYDENKDMLSFPYSVDEVDPPLHPKKPGRGLTEYVLNTGKPLLCDEALFESLCQRGKVDLVGVASPIWLGVPLLVNGKAIGVMAVQDYKNAYAYGEREQRILEFVSTQAAIAIHRKRSDEQIRQLNADLEQRVEARTQELRETQEKLVRQEKLAMLGQLAGGIGHELRNPLGIINNAIYYLKLIQPDADEKVKKYMGIIQSETHTADKIITDLLDFSRLKSLEKEPVQVIGLIEQSLARFPIPGNVRVIRKAPHDLPTIQVDPQHITQVLGNLVVNACQAIAAQGSTTGVVVQDASQVGTARRKTKIGTVTITASRKWNEIAIAVTDTGVGIPPGNLAKIFEPLFTTKPAGIGLGLAVCKKLAEANGGRIEVQSVPGKGSTFTLYLPVEEHAIAEQ
jgi:PAS domain S-box-containing protein